MAYNIKDVFYLSSSVKIDKTTSGGGTGQLDLSAYIDPIARGRTKGTGLAIYKVHFGIQQDNANSDPIDDAESGVMSYGLLAGLGAGDNATGAASMGATAFDMTNSLLVQAGAFYGPKSQIANANTTVSMFPNTSVEPSKDVPYVIVRDNVVLGYQLLEQFIEDSVLSFRMECAQVSLDQATLNQLLRTQTV
jgi:hypothetical protein